jgi:hypothetical protein
LGFSESQKKAWEMPPWFWTKWFCLFLRSFPTGIQKVRFNTPVTGTRKNRKK